MASTHPILVTVEWPDEGKRLDLFLTQHAAQQGLNLSRTAVQKMIQQGAVHLKESPILQPSYRISTGEVFTWAPEQHSHQEPLENVEIIPYELNLSIVHEDADLFVINKPAGLVVHPAPGHATDTLVNALAALRSPLSEISGPLRPGIVHRLDQGTSGLIVVAKTDAAHAFLASQFAQRTLKRLYVGIVWGKPQPFHGEWDDPIGRHSQHRQRMAVRPEPYGRPAQTVYETIALGEDLSLLTFSLKTGRTHQIRVHAHAHGHPLFQDPLYGRNSQRWPKHLACLASQWPAQRPALHAYALSFRHPSTQEMCSFVAPPPPDICELVTCMEWTQQWRRALLPAF